MVIYVGDEADFVPAALSVAEVFSMVILSRNTIGADEVVAMAIWSTVNVGHDSRRLDHLGHRHSLLFLVGDFGRVLEERP